MQICLEFQPIYFYTIIIRPLSMEKVSGQQIPHAKALGSLVRQILLPTVSNGKTIPGR